MTTLNMKDCPHCDGLGYVAIRDCVGKIQYETTCQMCAGTGKQGDSQ